MNKTIKQIVCEIQDMCHKANCHDEAMDVVDIIENAEALVVLLNGYIIECKNSGKQLTQEEINKILYDKMMA